MVGMDVDRNVQQSRKLAAIIVECNMSTSFPAARIHDRLSIEFCFDPKTVCYS